MGIGRRTARPARESRVRVPGASLYVREVGAGRTVVVLHGGPDFDQRYLQPDVDRLADSLRLVYYDQRGRGRSAEGVKAEDVSMDSEMADLDAVRRQLAADRVALLGHSWGALLAIEYALAHPQRVSHLVLMNPAPASKSDFELLVKHRRETAADDLAALKAIAATAAYARGDVEAVAAYYRIHFQRALQRPSDLDRVVASLRASFTTEGILLARAIEDRLVDETWLAERYDPLPALAALNVPALVIGADHEIVPAPVAEHIARAIPGARLVVLEGCGHFAYLECPEAVKAEVDAFFRANGAFAPAR